MKQRKDQFQRMMIRIIVVCVLMGWGDIVSAQDAAVKFQETSAKTPQPGDVWTEPQTGMEFVWINGGCFQMGSPDNENGRYLNEGPVHKVCVDGFWMGKDEVTQAQWQKIMGKNPSYFKGDTRPVERVSWEDAQAFLKNFRSLGDFGSLGDMTVRLPTETEWEYACRAGTQTAYSFGDDVGQLGDYAWYPANSNSQTHPVGQKKPNAWGLYDMHGNVWEWCQDWYDETYYGQSPEKNPQGPGSGQYRLLRGGQCQPLHLYADVPQQQLRFAARRRWREDSLALVPF